MNIELIYASQDLQPIIQNLARFYIYDLSEYQKRPCPADGLYEDEDYSRYWQLPDHHPFLIKAGGELAGFALTEDGGSHPAVEHQIAEFFVLRKFRGEGVASSAAQELFRRFPGQWELMVIPQNKPAVSFWDKLINQLTAGDFTRGLEFHEVDMLVFRFSISPPTEQMDHS